MLDPVIALDVLLNGDRPVLWETHSRREVCRFLRVRGNDLPKESFVALCEVILQGPPRKKYRDDLSDDDWSERKDHEIWLCLAKLRQSGAELIPAAEAAFQDISGRRPWILADDLSDEFPFFVGGGWVDKNELALDFDSIGDKAFSEWAMDEGKRDWNTNGWEGYCDEHPDRALERMERLAAGDNWPIIVWRTTFWRLSEQKDAAGVTINQLAQLINRMPTAVLGSTGVAPARWLKSARPAIAADVCWELWMRIWEASQNDVDENEDTLNAALNHAGGVLAEVLMNALGEVHPLVNIGEVYGLPDTIRPFFNAVADGNTQAAKRARTMLAPHMLYLYRADPDWTQTALIDRMAPGVDEFEPSIWHGYLWSPKIADDLLISIKGHLISVLADLACIPEDVRRKAVRLFVLAAVPPKRDLTDQDAKATLQSLDPDYLGSAAWMLGQMLKDAEGKSLTLWREVIQPWFNVAWPTHERYKTSAVSKDLAWMAIDAGEAFPEIVLQIEGLLTEEEFPGVTIMHLKNSGQHKRFPDEAMLLINKIVVDHDRAAGSRLDVVLADIEEARRNQA